MIRDADKKGLSALSDDSARLAAAARGGELADADLSGGTFTVVNLGMYGVRQFSGVINPPQAAMLSVGAVQKRIVPDEDPQAELPYKEATMVDVTLTCDHRVVDGAVGAQWLAAFKSLVEKPITMLL